MKQIIMLPTWLIVKCSQRFLRKNHPLKGKITLVNWSKNSTELCMNFSISFWVMIICGIIAMGYVIYE